MTKPINLLRADATFTATWSQAWFLWLITVPVWETWILSRIDVLWTTQTNWVAWWFGASLQTMVAINDRPISVPFNQNPTNYVRGMVLKWGDTIWINVQTSNNWEYILAVSYEKIV